MYCYYLINFHYALHCKLMLTRARFNDFNQRDGIVFTICVTVFYEVNYARILFRDSYLIVFNVHDLIPLSPSLQYRVDGVASTTTNKISNFLKRKWQKNNL